MVYCGKPSKGCSNCRERKIRDQQEPGCGQCEKRRQQCPGYRNIVDLMFRDESSHVIRKATKARRAKSKTPTQATACPGTVPAVAITTEASPTRPASPAGPNRASGANSPPPSPRSASLNILTPASSRWPGTSGHTGLGSSRCITFDDDDDSFDCCTDFPSPDDGTWPQPPPTAVVYALAPSVEQQGIAYFFAQHVTADEMTNVHPFDFIFDIWRPARTLAERQNDSVMAAMAAVGLAGLSTLKGCPDTMEWSRKSYGTALRLTNNALRIPGEVVKDTTMLSVLILSMYEMMTGRDPQTVQAWQEHVNGAATLAKMRGAGQFSSRAGVRMFNMLTQTVLISCVQRDLPMPSALADLRTELESIQPSGEGDPGWSLSGPTYKILQLRHDVRQGLHTSANDVITQLLAADRELSDMAAASVIERKTGYRVARVSRTNDIFFGDYCHIYASPAQATAWNDMRSIRMLVHETIVDQVLQNLPLSEGILPYEYRLLLSRSARLLKKLRDAILATVPQHLGNIKSKDLGSVHSNDVIQGGAPVVGTVKARKPPTHFASSPRSVSMSSASSSAAGSPDSTCEAYYTGPAGPLGRGDTYDAVSAEQVMTLASASNTIVWPLYLVGVSYFCTPEVKEYVLARLRDVHRDTGFVQAQAVASIVAAKGATFRWNSLELRLGDMKALGVSEENVPM